MGRGEGGGGVGGRVQSIQLRAEGVDIAGHVGEGAAEALLLTPLLLVEAAVVEGLQQKKPAFYEGGPQFSTIRLPYAFC